MKPIIMDMKEMTLSKEVYDKKPGGFISIFIYGLLVLLSAALAWSYFGKIDIVIRAQGMIRPNAQTAMVINAVSGEVQEVFFYEGRRVNKGDVLYIISTFHLENEKRLFTERISHLNFELKTLELFHASIESGVNLINHFNEEYSARIDTFLLNLNTTQHNANNRLDILLENELGLEMAIENVKFELEILRAFEGSIQRGLDRFGGAAHENNTNREVRNTYRNQYQRFVLETENLYFQIQVASESLAGYRLLRDSVDQGINVFPEDGFRIYRNMYDEHLRTQSQFMEMYNQAQEHFTSYTALHDIGVLSRVELQEAEIRVDNARVALSDLRFNFMLHIDDAIRTAENRITQLENQVHMLRVGTLASISSQLMNLEIEMININQSLAQSRLQRDSLFFVGDEIGDVVMLRLSETNRTLEQLNIIEQEIIRLTLGLEGIEAQINDSVVRTPITGIVSVQTELTEGGFIPGGVQVLSVIPARENMIGANIIIGNNDIGLISEGMSVRYDITAMPRRDFGEINGTITRISSDITPDGRMVGFFLVESEIEDRIYYDTRGNGVELRVGMAFEARIVVERQRILFYLLDKLNLLLN
ncbi:MAG: HlyD family efflux transporter periplasmic adaptor subunit [Defluviitaleaceae bacterium]|nr:HlyD family efflux transporter periplasmic adaptor subunit [Defluviitaleaceae bacterium]